jgi:hypothetical protein
VNLIDSGVNPIAFRSEMALGGSGFRGPEVALNRGERLYLRAGF